MNAFHKCYGVGLLAAENFLFRCTDSSCQTLQPHDGLCFAHADWAAWKCLSEQYMKWTNCALKLGRKGKTAGNVHYLKCCRMRNRCRHGICGAASYTAYAGSWQAKLVSNPQLCKSHHHNWHPGWQSQPRVSDDGCWNIAPLCSGPLQVEVQWQGRVGKIRLHLSVRWTQHFSFKGCLHY